MAMVRILPVILSGGAGTRLWPLSRAARPKQLLALTGEKTMLELTAARVLGEAFSPPVVVCNARHADEIAAQLGPGARLILEPAGRNTAPAVALAALQGPEDELLLVMPSDQLIGDATAFAAAIAAARPAASDGWLVTFGIAPTHAETGYGYIKRGAALGEGVWAVDCFVEKPDFETAKAYLAEGGYSWNGGIFLFRADAYLAALGEHAPDILARCREAMGGARRQDGRVHPAAEAFAASPSESIDYAVMEKAGRVAVVPVAMGWSDVGSWDALHEISDKDADGNSLAGEALAIDADNNLIRSSGPVVTVVGVDNLIIVATSDAVLVLPRGESQRVKEAVEGLKALRHPTLDH